MRHAAGAVRRRRHQGRGIGEGDWARTLGTRYGNHSAFSIIGNLGKRSIAVDLKAEAGKEVLWRLLQGADVFLEGFRPGVIKRLGFDYEAVPAREPRLLYVSISGFGQTGPLAERPAMDPVLQAYTGLMAENRGEDGIPHRVPVIVVDMSTALYAFQALSAALYARRDEPRGRYIDVSLMQAATALQSIRLMACHLEGGTMRPGGAPGGVFKTADGWMSILAFNDRDWRLCTAHAACRPSPTIRASPTPERARQRRGALRHRPAGDRRRAMRGVDRAADRAGLMHERLNSYAEFLDQPHVSEPACPVADPARRHQAGAGSALPGMLPRPRARRAAPHPSPASTPRSPRRARLRRRRDRRAAGARDSRQRRMKSGRRKPWSSARSA